MENTPGVSVIVPCYNSVPYLPRLFESFRRQTFKDFEVIFVDDVSTDDTAARLVDFARERPPFRVIAMKLKRHGGVSGARNAGLSAAHGKYLAFVDSDDAFAPDYLRLLYETAETENADFVSCGVRMIHPDGRVQVYYSSEIVSGGGTEEVLGLMTQLRLNLTAWGNLISRELVMSNGIRYENVASEDFVFSFKVLLFCKKIVSKRDILYDYIRHPNSLSHIALSSHRSDYSYIESFVTILSRVQNYLNEMKKGGRLSLPPRTETEIYLFWLRLAIGKLEETATNTSIQEMSSVLDRYITETFGDKSIYIRTFLNLVWQAERRQQKSILQL